MSKTALIIIGGVLLLVVCMCVAIVIVFFIVNNSQSDLSRYNKTTGYTIPTYAVGTTILINNALGRNEVYVYYELDSNQVTPAIAQYTPNGTVSLKDLPADQKAYLPQTLEAVSWWNPEQLNNIQILSNSNEGVTVMVGTVKGTSKMGVYLSHPFKPIANNPL